MQIMLSRVTAGNGPHNGWSCDSLSRAIQSSNCNPVFPAEGETFANVNALRLKYWVK